MENNVGWLYCFMIGEKAVFLNRKDQVIKKFKTYKEAEEFANNNQHLINNPPHKSKKV